MVLLSNEFDVSSNSLSSVVYGCIAPDRGYPPPPVPMHWLVRPCTSQCVSLRTANSLLANTTAILGGSESVHPCTFLTASFGFAETSLLLTGCQWFHAVSSYVNLQHPCCKLTCEFCKSKTSFLPNTPAILGGSEQNSKQPNVHGCIFGCDDILGASELAFLSIKTDNKCSEPYDDFSLIHLENPIRQNLS